MLARVLRQRRDQSAAIQRAARHEASIVVQCAGVILILLALLVQKYKYCCSQSAAIRRAARHEASIVVQCAGVCRGLTYAHVC